MMLLEICEQSLTTKLLILGKQATVFCVSATLLQTLISAAFSWNRYTANMLEKNTTLKQH